MKIKQTKQTMLIKEERYVFINKALYIPEIKTLVFGDMHLGYEFTFRDPGSFIPKIQIEQTKKDITNIFEQLKKEKRGVKKVVFIGDIKHFFAYEKGERNIILDILLLVGERVSREDIIVLKGNHEKMSEIADKKLLGCYIKKDVAFIHGDVMIKQVFGRKINLIVMGHLHPAITLRDRQGIKSEKYKVYLVGKFKSKEIVILPSFLPTVEGLSINEYLTDSHCIIPAKKLKEFNIFAIGKNKIYDFKTLKKLMH